MVGSKSICPKWHFGEVEHGDIWATFWSILLVKKSMFSSSVASQAQCIFPNIIFQFRNIFFIF